MRKEGREAEGRGSGVTSGRRNNSTSGLFQNKTLISVDIYLKLCFLLNWDFFTMLQGFPKTFIIQKNVSWQKCNHGDRHEWHAL